jgi:prophage regulatory protein
MSKPDIDPTRRRYRRAPQQLALRIEEPLAPPANSSSSLLTADNVHVLATPAFFRIRDVLRMTALSRPTLYRRIAAGRFPAPVHLGGRACAWSHSALQTWIADPEGYRSRPVEELPVRRGPGRPRKYAA